MKIMLLITGLDVGGAEIQVVKLAKKFRSFEHSVSVVSLTREKAFKDELLDNGIRVESLNITGVLSLLSSVPRYVALIHKNEPDIIHSHMYHANIYSRLLKLFYRKTPIISTAHSSNEGGGLRNILYKLTKKIPSLTTNVSKNSISRFISLNLAEKNRAMHVYNGISVEDIRKKKYQERSGIFNWVAVGRLIEDKGYVDLIHAVKIIENHHEFDLKIYGQGHQHNMLQNLIDDLNLTKKIHLMGLNKDIMKILQKADAFVMTSVNEGLPMVLLEASVAGLPIVATEVGGNSEIVSDGSGGYIVNPSAPFELSRAMMKIMSSNLDDRLKMGQVNQEHVVNTFNLDVVAKRWIDIYSSIIYRKDS